MPVSSGRRVPWAPGKESVNNLVHTGVLSKKYILKILSQIPTSGYDPDIPTYKLLSHAALSGAMYAEPFEAYNDKAASAYIIHVDIIQSPLCSPVY